ncbi:hypothetical protein ACTWQH_23215, partial [Streptomyces sp. 6N223]
VRPRARPGRFAHPLSPRAGTPRASGDGPHVTPHPTPLGEDLGPAGRAAHPHSGGLTAPKAP